MYKSQFQKIDPYDWFCGPGSHTVYLHHNIYSDTAQPYYYYYTSIY